MVIINLIYFYRKLFCISIALHVIDLEINHNVPSIFSRWIFYESGSDKLKMSCWSQYSTIFSSFSQKCILPFRSRQSHFCHLADLLCNWKNWSRRFCSKFISSKHLKFFRLNTRVLVSISKKLEESNNKESETTREKPHAWRSARVVHPLKHR